MQTKPEMNRGFWLAILLLALISLLGFQLVDALTFRPRPGGAISGNGNPAILGMLLAVPTYAALLLMTGFTGFVWFLGSGRIAGVVLRLVLVLLGLLAYGLERLNIHNHLIMLGGGPRDQLWESFVLS